jgi:ornithine carbamoyltransferase
MSFLTIADTAADRLGRMVEVGLEVKASPEDHRKALDGMSVGLFFQKQSLRTWVSCDIATIQLGAHPIVIRNDQTGLGSRESAADVGRVLGRYLDALGMRVFDHSDLTEIDAATAIPLINLLSDLEHPCQAVADMMTVADHLPLDEATITYVGDGNNVCHSLMLAAVKLGSAIRVVSPPGYEPDATVTEAARAIGDVMVTSDLEAGVAGTNVIYTDVWTSMGQEAEAELRRRHFTGYQITPAVFDHADADAIFMHCLPAHRGEEVSDEMMEHRRSMVFDQAENRLHSFKAVLLDELG